MFCSAALNIILDIVFIVSFKWGVQGAAIATVISQAVAAIASAVYLVVAVPTLKGWYFHVPFSFHTWYIWVLWLKDNIDIENDNAVIAAINFFIT